jgi:hypothetical protein
LVEGAVILVPKIRERRDLSRCSSCSGCRRRACGRDAVPLPGRFQRIRRRLGAVKITPIDERCAGCRRTENRNKQQKGETFHTLDSNRRAARCQYADAFYRHEHTIAPTWRCVFELPIFLLRGKCLLRQGLWIEDLQTPPGQECSNGSMILLAVVLWRASFRKLRHPVRVGPAIRNETS